MMTEAIAAEFGVFRDGHKWIEFENSEETSPIEAFHDQIPPTSINDLPTELLDYIFSLLDVRQRLITEFVCVRWRYIGTDLPWTYLTKLTVPHNERESFPYCLTKLSDNLLSLILSRCGLSLKQLTLSAMCTISKGLTAQSAVIVGECCPNLEEIDVALPIDNASLKVLAQGCPKLKIINIYNTIWNYDYNEGVLAIVNYCTELECLGITDLRIRGEWLEKVNSKLKSLRLTYCTLKPRAMQNLIRQCNSLDELYMVFCKPIDELALFKVLDHFSETLKILGFNHHPQHLKWCEGLKLVHNLEELYLSNCNFVDDELMDVIGKECSKLRVLDISATDVTDDGLIGLTSLCCLKGLFINHTDGIYGDGLRLLAEQGKLEVVKAVASSNISEESFCYLANVCPNLRYLDVTDASQITSRLVNRFCSAIKSGFLKGPLKLVVAGLDKCKPSAITKEVELCKGIEVIFAT